MVPAREEEEVEDEEDERREEKDSSEAAGAGAGVAAKDAVEEGSSIASDVGAEGCMGDATPATADREGGDTAVDS